MTEEDDTVEDVSRDADEEDDGVDVADEDVVKDGGSLIADEVVGVVPRNKAVDVIRAVAFTVVILNLRYLRHCIRNQLSISPPQIFCLPPPFPPESAVNEHAVFFSVLLL